MSANRFEATVPAGRQPQMHLRAEPFRLSNEARGQAQIDNEALMFDSRDDIGERNSCGRTAAPTNHALEATSRGKIPVLTSAEAPLHPRLNAFFAISVNSPAMSMVNFSCCVCSAPKSCASGVTRKIAPRPMRAAVRTEAGAHACL
jgi:hypothetical protein